MAQRDLSANSALPDATQITAHRTYLYRYAVSALRDDQQAEDVVQETLLAALEKGREFAGRSALRTWLTGILKHKIMDVFRRQAREPSVELRDDEGGETQEEFEELYFESGTEHWHSKPQSWGDPEQAFEQKRFWEAFEACSKIMPAALARVFLMRELLGLETSEICKELRITSTNCWVMLYRARMSLRECLEIRWFKA